MIVSIHQPGYLSWHGLFHRLALSDLHVFLDTAQFEKHGYNNRVKIRTARGEQWLTVPVLTKGRFKNNPIYRTELNGTVDWKASHWKTLCLAYRRAPYFEDYVEFFQEFYGTPWKDLASLNIHGVKYFANRLGLACHFIRASELAVDGQKSELVLNVCRTVGATTYLSGVNGRNYLDRPAFQRAGITLRFQAYREPHYRQIHGEFRSYMSIVDMLFNNGPASDSILLTGQNTLETGSVNE
jgi:hypothetical protein